MALTREFLLSIRTKMRVCSFNCQTLRALNIHKPKHVRGCRSKKLRDRHYYDFPTITLTNARSLCNKMSEFDQSSSIEKIQRRAFRIILGSSYESYRHSCERLSAKTLQERRNSLVADFALSLPAKVQMNDLLPEARQNKYNLRKPRSYICPKTRTERMRSSTIPTCIRHLNDCWFIHNFPATCTLTLLQSLFICIARVYYIANAIFTQ